VHLFPFQKVIAYGDKLAEAESERLAFLLLSISILKKLLHCSQAVRKLWLGCNSELNVLSVLFRILGYCKYSLRTVCYLLLFMLYEMSVCQGSDYEDNCLPGYDAIQSGR
jgi:hypothetical protein